VVVTQNSTRSEIAIILQTFNEAKERLKVKDRRACARRSYQYSTSHGRLAMLSPR